jgi:hypothetical protein
LGILPILIVKVPEIMNILQLWINVLFGNDNEKFEVNPVPFKRLFEPPEGKKLDAAILYDL